MNIAQNILFHFSLENIYINNLIIAGVFLLLGLCALGLIIRFIILLDDNYKMNKMGKLIFLLSFFMVGLSSHVVSRSLSHSDALYSIDNGKSVYSVEYDKTHFECSMTDIFTCFHLQKHISRLEVFDRATQKTIVIHECNKLPLYECIDIIDFKFDKLFSQPTNHFVFDDIIKL